MSRGFARAHVLVAITLAFLFGMPIGTSITPVSRTETYEYTMCEKKTFFKHAHCDSWIAIAYSSGDVVVNERSAASGLTIDVHQGRDVTALEFSDNDKFLAIGDDAGFVSIHKASEAGCSCTAFLRVGDYVENIHASNGLFQVWTTGPVSGPILIDPAREP